MQRRVCGAFTLCCTSKRARHAWRVHNHPCDAPRLCVEDCEHVDQASAGLFGRLLDMAQAGRLVAPLLIVLAVRGSEGEVETRRPSGKEKQTPNSTKTIKKRVLGKIVYISHAKHTACNIRIYVVWYTMIQGYTGIYTGIYTLLKNVFYISCGTR